MLIHIINQRGLKMWEITLIGDKCDLSNFYIIMKTIFAHKNSVFASFGFGDKNTLKIGVNDKKYIPNVKSEILEAIITINKQEYFNNNIIVKNSNNMVYDFIMKSIVMLGLDDELEYARVKVKLGKVVHIRSIVRFKLAKFYSLWDRLIVYLNEYLGDGDENDKMLKFLASNINHGSDIFFVNFDDSGIKICDLHNHVISEMNYDDVYLIIISIMVLSPKKIIIKQLLNISNEKISNLISKMDYVFDDRVSYVM